MRGISFTREQASENFTSMLGNAVEGIEDKISLDPEKGEIHIDGDLICTDKIFIIPEGYHTVIISGDNRFNGGSIKGSGTIIAATTGNSNVQIDGGIKFKGGSKGGVSIDLSLSFGKGETNASGSGQGDVRDVHRKIRDKMGKKRKRMF